MNTIKEVSYLEVMLSNVLSISMKYLLKNLYTHIIIIIKMKKFFILSKVKVF